MANDIFSEQERASIFIPAGRTLLTLLSGQLNAAFKPSDFIMDDFLNIIGDIRPRVGQGLVEAEELARRLRRASEAKTMFFASRSSGFYDSKSLTFH